MSRLVILSLSIVASATALFAPVPVHAADEPKDILEKAIKAHGGEEYLTKHKAAELKTKGKIDLPGVGEVEFTQETSFMLPDKFRDSLELTIAGQSIPVKTLINGNEISIEANGMAVKLDDNAKKSIKDISQVLEVFQLVPLKNKKYELNLIGDEMVEGKAAVGIRVSAKGMKDVSIYFYKDSGLTAKVEYRTVDAGSGNEITEERFVTEYQKQDGKPAPKTILVKRDGKKFLEAEVVELKRLEKLDDSVFKK